MGESSQKPVFDQHHGAVARRLGYHTLTAIPVALGLLVGGVLHVIGADETADLVWAATGLLVLGPLAWSVLGALRRRQLGVDIIALLAIAGALVAGEYLAGAVIALMLSGGNALEEFARGRASRELRSLAERAPREAHVRRGDAIVEIAATDVAEGDAVIVRAGEVVPVDAYVRAGVAILDESALTGEPLPVRRPAGAAISSGASNAGESFEAVALRTAGESMYAGIVRLVEAAVARRAPMVRMADRYSVVFLAVTLTVAGVAWAVSADPVTALAVLVVATPCPLILAPPVALVAGTSRAARKGVIVKGAAAVEALGRAVAVLIDKTGTITLGTPRLRAVTPTASADADSLLRYAASVEQMSVHTLAEAIAHAGADRFGTLPLPTDVREQPGHGISGTVEGHRIDVGSAHYVQAAAGAAVPHVSRDGSAIAHIALDGTPAGWLELADAIREDALGIASGLAGVGIERVAMATGDHLEAAHRIAGELGISEVHAECTPREKLEILDSMRAGTRGGTVIMVGDGVNDAPALAAADVGIAMGSAGATAASEAAEAIIISSRVSATIDAIRIGKRSTVIARQSIIAGMSLSMAGMLVAAAGYLPPVYGALTQEAIDLAVILNALRALLPPRGGRRAAAVGAAVTRPSFPGA